MTRSEVVAKINEKALELVQKGEAKSQAHGVDLIIKKEPELYTLYKEADIDVPQQPASVQKPETGRDFIAKIILFRADELQQTGLNRLAAIERAIQEKQKLYSLRSHPRIAHKLMSAVIPTPKPAPSVVKIAKMAVSTAPAVTRKPPLVPVAKRAKTFNELFYGRP